MLVFLKILFQILYIMCLISGHAFSNKPSMLISNSQYIYISIFTTGFIHWMYKAWPDLINIMQKLKGTVMTSIIRELDIHIHIQKVSKRYEFVFCPCRDVLHTSWCSKSCLWLSESLWVSPSTWSSSDNDTVHHHIHEIWATPKTLTLFATCFLILYGDVCLKYKPQLNIPLIFVSISSTFII